MTQINVAYRSSLAPGRDVSWSFGESIGIALLTWAAAAIAGDWIAGAAVAVLFIVWKYMRDDEGLPVLALALSFQWFQVTGGVWYFLASGRRLDAMVLSDYRPMVLAGLGCVSSLVIGLRAGFRIVPGQKSSWMSGRAGRNVSNSSWLPQ